MVHPAICLATQAVVDPGLISAFSIMLGGLVVYQVAFFFVKRWAKNQERYVPRLLQSHIYMPGLLLFLFITLTAGIPFLGHFLSGWLANVLQHVLAILVIGSAAWLLMRGMTVFREITLHRYKVANPLDFTVRKAQTRFQLIQHVLNFLIILAGIAAALMTFKGVRQIGSTLLASAGVVGVVLGFAAQKSLGTLFAGIQIAISQPIRIGDVVVVDNQFGTIGEISLTYVVVNTWDGRRLIVPINYFLEKTFENWTRVTPEVVGKVKIYTDYTLPVEKIRKEATAWVEQSQFWDKRKCSVLITGATDKTMELRVTASARNSDDAFDLECYIREKLITYIQQHYPDSLPRSRVELTGQKQETN